MINEKKLIEEMNKTFPDRFLNDKNWFMGKCSFMDLFQEIIEQMPKVGEWIPCSERLPERDTQVIITTDYGAVYADYWYGYANESNEEELCFHRWDDEMYSCYKPKVIAWMPLPKAYNAERGGKNE